MRHSQASGETVLLLQWADKSAIVEVRSRQDQLRARRRGERPGADAAEDLASSSRRRCSKDVAAGPRPLMPLGKERDQNGESVRHSDDHVGLGYLPTHRNSETREMGTPGVSATPSQQPAAPCAPATSLWHVAESLRSAGSSQTRHGPSPTPALMSGSRISGSKTPDMREGLEPGSGESTRRLWSMTLPQPVSDALSISCDRLRPA